MRQEDIFDRFVSLSWMRWFRPVYYRFREMWLYALFGLGTVLINLYVYQLFTERIPIGVLLANAIAWIFATLFAFFTNRKWVFTTHQKGVFAFFMQMGGFFAGRLFTLVIEEAMLYFLVEVYEFPNMLIKFLSQFIVIALNYLISKWFVFRGKEVSDDKI